MCCSTIQYNVIRYSLIRHDMIFIMYTIIDIHYMHNIHIIYYDSKKLVLGLILELGLGLELGVELGSG